MKNFTKNIRRKSIIALLFMFLVTSLLSVAFTMSKYVIEKPVGNLTLNLTSVDTLMPGLQLRNTLGTSVTEVVFGKTDDYESEIVGIEPTNVDLKKTGKIKLYVKGTKAYILSNRKIYAHPNSFHTFFELKELTSVDFSNFETGMVTNMRGMFRGCDKLTEVKNVTSWNTKNVEDMEFLFRGCSSLTTLDLSKWDTAAVTNMNSMFYGCGSLTSLDLSSWDTGKVSNMYCMFRGCKKLETIDVSSWNTAAVTNMFCMFYECGNLDSLDLSGWDTGSVTDMSHMFFNCGKLASVYVGSGWNTDNASISGNMFLQCKKLTGGKGTSYDDGHTDKSYARIDGGTENPGYFTDIADKP